MLAFALLLSPLNLDRLSPADALSISGLPIVASIEAGNPPDTIAGLTYFGSDTHPDGVVRSATLPGEHDIRQGERITVAGWLRVLVLPSGTIDVRIDGVRKITP